MEAGGMRARFSARARDFVQDGTPNVAHPTTSGSAPYSASGMQPARKSWNPWRWMRPRSRYRILDILVNCFLLTPLAVLFQVGSCGIQDVLFLNSVSPSTGTCILLALGITIEFSCSFWQQWLSSIRLVSKNDPSALSYITVTRLYHFAIAFANVCHYRGLSDIYYYFLGYGSNAAAQLISTTTLLLLGLRCARNVLGPPLCVGVDTSIDKFFETSTLFRTKNDKYVHHMADNAVTVLVVTSLCFLHWIAVWALFDATIYPDHAAKAVVTSWIIGYILVFLMFIIESNMKSISKALELRSRAQKILFEDIVLLFANAGVILVWKGHWVFFEGLMHRFPIYHGGMDVSAFYGIFASFLMMCFLHTSATLIMKGCDVFDGELEGGEGLAFGIDYFAEFFQREIHEEEDMLAGRYPRNAAASASAFVNNNPDQMTNSNVINNTRNNNQKKSY